jgi:hypothetical protein
MHNVLGAIYFLQIAITSNHVSGRSNAELYILERIVDGLVASIGKVKIYDVIPI